ncbi:DUF2147 domain-containing protein [Spirosoma pollinicola]|uniref:DUF2147 domain-containing protein n=1 Tax=Spirosoma pollinicola TaxID=2057025 RepID=A0A2K8Z0H0_9BACT|nr:DUF2147 domain-containing protein [Spirosoma pollinicola]AUD03308.1 DUF2147 domain-containing protein [Spirosoma pollinicola]
MNPFRLTLLLLLTCFSVASFAHQSDGPDAIEGKWLSSKKRNQVQIYKQGNKYFGKLVWMLEPNDPATNKPKVDKENPNEKLRNRPLMNLVLVTNLVYKGNNIWGDGEIYNPEDGKTYNCEVTIKDANSIDLRGYVMGLSFLGKSKTWTRVK